MSIDTNVRDTSLLAFEQIKREGILGRLQWQVYALLFEWGPMTAREITQFFQDNHGSEAITSFEPRLPELERMGVVHRPFRRQDRRTGRLAYVWDVTSQVPTREKRAPLKGPRKTIPFLQDKERLSRLKAECEKLFNENVMSDDFYALVVFLEGQGA